MSAPNILLITTDQQRWDTLNAAGHQEYWTPHLDWLCDSGVRFENAYSDCPVCMPARLTIMTGNHASTHGVLSNRFRPESIQRESTLPGRLTAAGYQTRHVGKTHFGPVGHTQGFEHVVWLSEHERELQRHAPQRSSQPHGMGGNEFSPAINPLPQHQAQPAWLVDRTLDFLETRDPSRPFFCWMSTNYPHPPFTPSMEAWNLYQNKTMSPRREGTWSDPKEIPPAFTAVTRELSMGHRFSDDQLADIRRAYGACLTEVDQQLGRLFGKLTEERLLENTWIIFTTDHGELLGDHHLVGKCVPLDAAARIPFIVRPPAAPRDCRQSWRGTVRQDLVCLADILPSCLDMANATLGDNVDGNSFVPSILEGEDGKREAMFISCMYLHGVRKGPWKYCLETLDESRLLFNVVDDPYEQNNLIGDPAHSAIEKELDSLLNEHLESKDLVNFGDFDPGVIQSTQQLPEHTHPGIRSGRRAAD